MPENPYASMQESAFWRSAVADRSPFQIEGLWHPKFKITRRTPIATAGSCFAQHFGRALRSRRYRWINEEPAPVSLSKQHHAAYHFNTFSFRTGNIYTVRMLRQWVLWASGREDIPDVFWRKGSRYIDPFRPGIEPNGFASIDEVKASRAVTLAAVKRAISNAQIFVFTMGLTEAWRDVDSDVEFAICPGTLGGEFDPDTCKFFNAPYPEIFKDLNRTIGLMRRMNKNLSFLLTVSPVPLTATASGHHVLTATSHSKSVLRAVAGQLAEQANAVDYFPSYEIISNSVFRGMFYSPNMRSVESTGVDFVMKQFFQAAEGRTAQAQPASRSEPVDDTDDDELLCEEEILDAFQSSR